MNEKFINRLVELTNIKRSDAGLSSLEFNPLLAKAAQQHSKDMALNDYFDPTGSDGSSSSERIARTGYKASFTGENIAVGQSTPEEVMNSWMNEIPPNDGHRRNILSPDYQDIGVGYYFLDDDTGDEQDNHY